MYLFTVPHRQERSPGGGARAGGGAGVGAASTPGRHALLRRAGTDLSPGARSLQAGPQKGSQRDRAPGKEPPAGQEFLHASQPSAVPKAGGYSHPELRGSSAEPSPAEPTFTATRLSAASVPHTPLSGRLQGRDVSCGLRHEFAPVLSPQPLSRGHWSCCLQPEPLSCAVPCSQQAP